MVEQRNLILDYEDDFDELLKEECVPGAVGCIDSKFGEHGNVTQAKKWSN